MIKFFIALMLLTSAHESQHPQNINANQTIATIEYIEIDDNGNTYAVTAFDTYLGKWVLDLPNTNNLTADQLAQEYSGKQAVIYYTGDLTNPDSVEIANYTIRGRKYE